VASGGGGLSRKSTGAKIRLRFPLELIAVTESLARFPTALLDDSLSRLGEGTGKLLFEVATSADVDSGILGAVI
jgi:hypothetical protein